MREFIATVRSRSINVKADFIAFHRWKDAPEEAAFLRDFHRHLFQVAAVFAVGHGDRQLEFFDVQKTLLSVVRKEFEGKRFELSCEQIAEEIGKRMAFNCYKVLAVEVSEDGENSGTVYFDTRERYSGEVADAQPVKLTQVGQTPVRKTYRPACQGEDTAPLRRTKAEVLRRRSTVSGCCDRHADNQACDCLENAID